jgi:uncharacterized membrane protein required for colicin V production
MYDFIVFVIIVGCVVAQAMRGFGHALYDIAALYVTLLLTYNVHESLAHVIHFSHTDPVNDAVAYAVMFVVLGGAMLVLSHAMYNIATLSLEPFDATFGGILGLFSGIIIAHAFVSMLVIHSGGSQTMLPTQIANSVLSKEVYTFQGVKGIIARLRPGGP